MQHEVIIRISPKFSEDQVFIKKEFAKALNFRSSEVYHVEILKRSIDARKKQIKIQLKGIVYVNEKYIPKVKSNPYKKVNTFCKWIKIFNVFNVIKYIF